MAPQKHSQSTFANLRGTLLAAFLLVLPALTETCWASTLDVEHEAPPQRALQSEHINPLPDLGPHLVEEGLCAGCHATQAKDWQGSHHRLAMQKASDTSVLGDFNDARFQGEGETTRFFRKDGGFWVNTPGVDGQPADFRVAYAFGVAPLQQYLIDVPGGRLQALGVAWDVDKRTWFHLYPGQGVDFKDPLHWSRPQQNANFMCMECHTTGFKRNYDPVTDSFTSQWHSLGVGCQACHGPASRHLDWAAKTLEAANAGFAIDLGRASEIAEVETCARCHARRAPLGDGYHNDKRLMDDYLPSILTRELYELDGKIKDEVFEYGTFTQSRMFAKGVRCSNCHNPHSTALKAPGNGVCLQCHNPSGKTSVAGVDGQGLRAKDYESPEHHRHVQGQDGSRCVDCHMPGKPYMVNDYRHDHGFTLPNPARAQRLDTTDACLECHGEQPGERIAEQFRLWYGEHKAAAPRYDENLWLIRNGMPGAAQALFQLLNSTDLPDIRRATLLAELPSYPSRKALAQARRSLDSRSPLVREAAVKAVALLASPQQHLKLLAPSLTDPVRAVRITAAYELLGVAHGYDEADWITAIAEYETVQSNLQERAEANLNLAQLFQASGRSALVEPYLRAALRRDPAFTPAQVALVQWLDTNHRGKEARTLLKQTLVDTPQSALLLYTDGLMRVRQGDIAGALDAFAAAEKLEPANDQYSYVHAVALHDSGQAIQARDVLTQLVRRRPANRTARLTLVSYWREAGHMQKAQTLLQELEQINPWDPALNHSK
ncbi:multiheme c-type cytochrome [Pseudomonas aeruginosa]|uniref:multiheme c-type cytochrome n=1 Tax=Pseudomonas aeruginosa TaxID=287 RepID=UPI0009A836B1|nr:multiheme c-type cytochrome [Pseudomonas aeruginosa]NNB82523.1 hypothetical protein [Pseudomonas aeruginosa]RUB26906.1 hypothetical protein IPC1432_25925 [Pseudomonas aeruginosa]HCD6631067.1 hypothetical protein [Pseudomonas aeruginosa]HCD7565593.1 hypothetical protein [Pseudomonas aeruginosa]HCZ9127882.1 hypothetical protein [Pseudomonas aeruginosa]